MLQQNVQRVGVAVLASPVEHRGSIIALLERARERRPAVRLLAFGLALEKAKSGLYENRKSWLDRS